MPKAARLFPVFRNCDEKEADAAETVPGGDGCGGALAPSFGRDRAALSGKSGRRADRPPMP